MRFSQRLQYAAFLLAILEKWKSAIDKGKSFFVLMTDLSKAFDCLSHEILLAKLHVYGFSITVLRLTHSYLTNRKQRTKVNLSYGPWEEILFYVPQGSILGPLLFNIFLCDLFFIMNETDLREHDSMILFQWFSDNQIKANISKCHLLVNKKDDVTIRIGDTEIKSMGMKN